MIKHLSTESKILTRDSCFTEPHLGEAELFLLMCNFMFHFNINSPNLLNQILVEELINSLLYNLVGLLFLVCLIFFNQYFFSSLIAQLLLISSRGGYRHLPSACTRPIIISKREK